MTVSPLYLSFIGIQREVKIRAPISFKCLCYSTEQLEKTMEVKPKKQEDIEVL